MRIGLQINNYAWPEGPAGMRRRLIDLARTADQMGFYSLWVMDHFFQIRGIGPAEGPMMEAYTQLSVMAGVTERVRLGTMVTAVVYRHPGVLVKTVTALDVLSGGRATLGIGAGWFEREALALGMPFPSLKERFERLEEALQIALQMWSEDNGPYHGRHYRLEETMNVPPALSQPHPPILIGGSGEKKTLRLVAQYADACNLFWQDDATLRHKIDVLKQHCADVGRDFKTIDVTVLGSAQTPDFKVEAGEVLERAQRLAEMGVTHWIVNTRRPTELADLEPFGKTIVAEAAKL